MSEWTITGMRKCSQQRSCNAPSQASTSSASVDISLDTIAAYDVDMDVGDRKSLTKITLHRVPSFLVEAFAMLDTNKAWSTEGVFRKEGNCTRMRDARRIYCGFAPIPKECTVHDVCCLIKRFFRELKPSIFIDKQRNILKFAETLHDKPLLQSILAITDTLPPSHKGTLAFLMRQLGKARLQVLGNRTHSRIQISESASLNQMNVENLAVVFAPTLFRDDPMPPTPNNRKKHGSQEDLLNAILKQNDLRASVIKLLITHAHMLGHPCAIERPPKHVVRRPSDLKRKQIAPTGFDPLGKKISQRSSSANPLRRIALDITGNGKQPKAKKSESPKRDARNAKNGKDFAKNRKRSSSVARIFSVISNFYTKPAAERRPSTPFNPNVVGMPTAGPMSRQIDLSDSDDNDDTNEPPILPFPTERLSRVQSPRRARGVLPPEGRMERKAANDARCKRMPASRTPISTVFNVEDNGQRDDRKTSTSTTVTAVQTDAPRPQLTSQKSMHALSVTPDNAVSLAEEHIKNESFKRQRTVALQVDRRRRHTAPVKQSGIKRNQPNTLKSGLVDPRARRCKTMVVFGNDENQPVGRRRTHSIDSSNEGSPSLEELDISEFDDVLSLSKIVASPNLSNDLLDQKGMESRRRRAKARRGKNIGPEDSSIFNSTSSTPQKAEAPRQALAVRNSNEQVKSSAPPEPSCPPPTKVSLESSRLSSCNASKASLQNRQPTYAALPERLSLKKDLASAPLATSVLDNRAIATALRTSSSSIHRLPQTTTAASVRPSTLPQQKSMDVGPKGTLVFVGRSDSTSAIAPKRNVGPHASAPMPDAAVAHHRRSIGSSRSPQRLASSRVGNKHSSGLPPGERGKDPASSSQDLNQKMQQSASSNISLTYFQRQNRGFVQQRVNQFATLLDTKAPTPR
ncbi:RhoGAP domain-containing protein [Aphelenchoides avenae]|nr:RhoGAP domain-containing protein [Aphelenchus avenae]